MTASDIFTVYWPVVAFCLMIVSAIVSIYINLNNKVNAANATGAERDKEIAELKGRVNTMQPTLGTIQTDIAVIKNTLEFIKGTVSKNPQVVNTN